MRFRTPGRGLSRASGDLSCSFMLGNRAFAGLTHLLSHFQKFLSKVEETFQCICCQELVFRPITTVCQHNVCKVRGGRGGRWEAPKGALTPAGTLGLLASLGPPAPCPSGASGSVSRAAWVSVALPSPTSLHHRCPLPCHHPAPPATMALCWALSRPVRAYLRGGHTQVFFSIFPSRGPGWERMGCCPAPAIWSH